MPLIESRVSDGIASLALVSPGTRNAISLEWGQEFRTACNALLDDADQVRVVVISAEGRVFCAGGDVGLFATSVHPYTTFRKLTNDLHTGLLALRSLDAPVIASVQGAAAGAGLSIVLAADLVIAAASATFTTAYTAIGLSCDGGCSYWLPRRVGSRLAMELMLTNRRVEATEALRIGIVNEVVPDDELVCHTHEFARKIANGPTAAYGEVKRLLELGEVSRSLEDQLEREALAIAELATSPTGREGVAAFVAKREPRFGNSG